MMETNRWGEIDQILDRALDLAPQEREAFLAEACAGDDGLRREIESLLAADEQAGGLLSGPVLRRKARDKAPVTGQRVGAYQIVREIGRGGMGAVYLAERADGQFKQQVAIKLIKRGMDTDEIVRRFQYERQILASLNHPNIARLLDGAMTEAGLPYFVMEYIEGEPLLEYCDRRELDVTERLRLFLNVCAAVQHAHNNLIVHRDLKPGNIIVTEEGAPKLLDFGIAKLLDSEQAGMSAVLGSRPMTPEYASPEQARGVGVTTASDVYSLGVVLYELLTGHRPYRLSNRTPDELLRVICEQEPEKPSSAIKRVPGEDSSNGSRQAEITPEIISAAREGQPERLRRRLVGDLDNIILMALRKEPERRYSSVAQFAEDIQRHLDGRPVIAQSNTFRYRATKFVRRNKLRVAVASVFALLLIGAAVLFTRQAARTARERDKAERVSQFLVDLFQASGPEVSKGDKLTVREVLDRGAAQIERELQDQPEVQGKLMHTIGAVYNSLGLYPRAAEMYKRAMEVRERALGRNHPDTAESMVGYGATQGRVRFKKEDLAKLFREALQVQREKLGPTHLSVATTLYELGKVIRWSYRNPQGAEPIFRESLEIRRLHLGNTSAKVAESLGDLSNAVLATGNIETAEQLAREALEINQRLYPANDFRVGSSKYALAEILHERREYVEAEKLLLEAERPMREVWPDGHTILADALLWIGITRMKLGKFEEAEAPLREMVQMRRRLLRLDEPETIAGEGALGACLLGLGRYAEAEPLLARYFTGIRDGISLDDELTIQGDYYLRYLYLAWNKREKLSRHLADYQESASKLLNKRLQEFGEGHPKVGRAKRLLAQAMFDNGDYQSAETMAREAQSIAEKHSPWETGVTLFLLGRIRSKQGDNQGAEAMMRKGLEGLESARKRPPADAWEIETARSQFGEYLAASGRYDEAAPLLRDSYLQLKTSLGSNTAQTYEALNRLIRLYKDWGKPQKAAEYRR